MRAQRTPGIGRLLRSLKKNTSGNAMLFMALGMPVLIASAGLAVDFSQWYLWKRELQLATDQAAMAAAWARTDSNTESTYQTRGSQDYYANLAITSGFASAPHFALANYANGTDNSVIVTATASKSLPFSSFIIGHSTTIQAYSQASFAAGANYSACLIATGSSGTTLSVGGNANVTAHCGMAALSCSNDAVVIDGSATVVTDSIATCGTASVPSANEDVVSENVSGLSDPYDGLDPPTNDAAQTYSCDGHGVHAQASPVAGTYHGLVVSCTTNFGPGVYVIDGGTLDLTGNYPVSGTNVMFVLKNGAQLKLGGSGNNNTLTLTPMVSSQFTAPPIRLLADARRQICGHADIRGSEQQPVQLATDQRQLELADRGLDVLSLEQRRGERHCQHQQQLPAIDGENDHRARQRDPPDQLPIGADQQRRRRNADRKAGRVSSFHSFLARSLRLLRDARGTTVIEVAIIAPVLVMLALGGFDVSRMIARQHELQNGAGDAEQIVLAAASGSATDTNTIKSVLANTLGIPNDANHIAVVKLYRCGTASSLVSTQCSSGSWESTYIQVTFHDTYTPVWTSFGVGSPVDYQVERLVQISQEQVP